VNPGNPRDDAIADALDAADDEQAWRATRDIDLGHEPGWVSRREMVESQAADRAAVEADWAARFDRERRDYERGRLRWVAQLALDREAERGPREAA
jgi:hypothetical protein